MPKSTLTDLQKHKLLTSFPYERKIVPSEVIINTLESEKESYCFELLNMMISLSGRKTHYNDVLEYVVTRHSGRLRALALSGNISKELFEEYVVYVEDENFKHLHGSKKLFAYPELFIKVWQSASRERGSMMLWLPDSSYKDLEFPENSTFAIRRLLMAEHNRNFVLNTVHPDIIAFINNNILNESTRDRESYAREVWADPAVLDVLKTDKSRSVINNVILNPFIWDSTAEYLIDNHKTPKIRYELARSTRSLHVLEKIYNSTKNPEIHKAILDNPLSSQLEGLNI